MRVVTTLHETRGGLQAIRRQLTVSLGRPATHPWSFPGAGRRLLPTWSGDHVVGKPLVVAIGSDDTWRTRTPLLIARAPLVRDMTPSVELNVPKSDGSVNRMVAGCLCRGDEIGYVIAHRGNSLTVTPRKVPKHIVHRHFSHWLVTVEDGDRHTRVIPAAPTGPDLVPHLARFADEVVELKRKWAQADGREARLRTRAAWRDQLNFPVTIARAVSASTRDFEYRHGPLQAALQDVLGKHLRTPLKTALNQMVDLAILKKEQVLALFEVKTDFGPQLYSGVGQLLLYRQSFASRKAGLFLVLPEGVRPEVEIKQVGRHLSALGIVLLVAHAHSFRRWDGMTLMRSLVAAGIPAGKSMLAVAAQADDVAIE